MKPIATILCGALLCATTPASAEAYCLERWSCQPAMAQQTYTKAWAVQSADRFTWKLNFGYYGFTNSTVRISVYGFGTFSGPICLDAKVYPQTPVGSWSFTVPHCDIYYQVMGQIIILQNGQPVDSASVSLTQ